MALIGDAAKRLLHADDTERVPQHGQPEFLWLRKFGQTMNYYCTQCGSELPSGVQFCTQCGAQANLASAPEPPAPMPTVRHVAPVTLSTPPPAATTTTSGGCRNLAIGAAIVLIALAALGIGGRIYAYHAIKQKAAGILHGGTSSTTTADEKSSRPTSKATQASGDAAAATRQDDGANKGLEAISGLLDRLSSGDAPSDPYSDLEVVKKSDIANIRCPAASMVASSHVIKPTAGRIPMREGLIVTTTYGRRLGDTEERMTTSSIEPGAMTITNNGLYFADDNDATGSLNSTDRVLCAADLKSADGFAHWSWAHSPSISPGVTSEILSAAAFLQLKETGKLTLRYLVYIKTPNEDGYYKHWQVGELSRVEHDDIPYSVIVNDSITTLPAIHARGLLTPQGKGANKSSKYAINRPIIVDLKVSDDPLNPIVLFFKFQDDPFRIEVTKIQFPNQDKKIEQALLKGKKAVIYGIYFDFNSDKIKPESKQVLDEIAGALKDNPDWKLTVDGHTDNIGGDAYNLGLSQRRAAAVKEALVTQYHITPDRLSSTGSGVAGAIDTNDTIVGRSHNRRVELTRQ
jgi:outer membrane protein OmpA-like peptidoglycan-associated protein